MCDYLPLGTVVILKNTLKKVMIVGISQVRNLDTIQEYDYVGVIYPLGVIGERSFIFFNNSDINDLLFQGYSNPEWEEFLEIVKNMKEKPVDTVSSDHVEKETNNQAFE